MKRLVRFQIVWLLLFSLCGSIAGTAVYPVQGQAAVVTRYYIYLDSAGYEVTKEEYEWIYQNKDNEQNLKQCLKTVLGDRMPASFSLVSGKVVTSDENEPADPITNQPYNSDDFVIRNGILVSYKGSAAIVELPDSVTEISSLAFYNNDKVKVVIVPSSVKSVGKYAFANCASLKYIVFPKETATFSDRIVYQCDKFTNFVAPKGSKAYKYAKDNELAVATGRAARFENSRAYLLVGDKEKIPLLNNINSVKWKSSKKSVVSVTSSGKITAKKKGTATITATAAGKSYSYKVTVYKKTVKQRVNQIVKSVVRSDMSKYEKVKAVHNWMIKNVKYDYDRLLTGTIPKVSHTAKGALIKKVAVCDGYAYAFQMVMKKAGIPCRFVVGRSGNVGHAWNMVKLGGKWYHVDTTFDDPIVNGSNANTTPYYTYFLKSTSVMKKTHSFNKSKYPKCTSKKYD